MRITFLFMGTIPKQLAVVLANVLGNIWFMIDKNHRDVAYNNLSNAFGDHKTPSEIRMIAREAFKNFARIPFEMGWALRLNLNDFMRYCRVNGFLNLQKAHAKGKGVLILTLHIGNWELLSNPVIFDGYKAGFVYRPLDFKPADKFITHYRSRFGGVPIPKKKSMRKILRPLKKGQCVGILLDQDSGRAAGVFADFFGKPACTNKGLALLALKTGAPVIPAFLARHGTRFIIEFGPEIPLVQTGQKEKDILANTQQYNRALEDIIRRYPEQWLWVHRRWKTQPPG